MNILLQKYAVCDITHSIDHLKDGLCSYKSEVHLCFITQVHLCFITHDEFKLKKNMSCIALTFWQNHRIQVILLSSYDWTHCQVWNLNSIKENASHLWLGHRLAMHHTRKYEVGSRVGVLNLPVSQATFSTNKAVAGCSHHALDLCDNSVLNRSLLHRKISPIWYSM